MYRVLYFKYTTEKTSTVLNIKQLTGKKKLWQVNQVLVSRCCLLFLHICYGVSPSLSFCAWPTLCLAPYSNFIYITLNLETRCVAFLQQIKNQNVKTFGNSMKHSEDASPKYLEKFSLLKMFSLISQVSLYWFSFVCHLIINFITNVSPKIP